MKTKNNQMKLGNHFTVKPKDEDMLAHFDDKKVCIL